MYSYRGIYSFSSYPVLLNYQEFRDTLSYISSLRDRAEPYGICCVVPPPSWKPPCLLKEKQIWEASTFFPQVQLFGIQTENRKIKKEVDADSNDAASEGVQLCRVERGPGYTLKSFKNFADTYKKSHFGMKDEVLGSENSSPSLKPNELIVADIEKEYRQIVESPLIEIGVMLKTVVLLLYMKRNISLTCRVNLGALWQ